MKYKTTIEIMSEAEDKNEAAEIVGEYLSGNLVSGVDMKCTTRPVNNRTCYVIGIAAVLLLAAISVMPLMYGGNSQSLSAGVPGNSAILPPLKTSIADKKEAGFKKMWQDRQTKAAIDFIKSK